MKLSWLVFLIVVLGIAWIVKEKLEEKNTRKEIHNRRVQFGNACHIEVQKRFLISIPCYYPGGDYYLFFSYNSYDDRCINKSDASKFDFTINFRLLRAVLCIMKSSHGILKQVEVYKKRGNEPFKHAGTLSRKEYINILINNGYHFGMDEEKLYAGIYKSQEEKESIEEFLLTPSQMPILYIYENDDYLKDY